MPPEGSVLSSAPAATPAPSGTPAAGAPPPPPAPIVNDKGEFREGWFESFGSEELKSAPSLKNIKTLEGMTKSYLSAQRMIGADKVVIPGEHSTPEERQEFFNRLGRPETPEGYEFPALPPERIPKGMQVNPEFEKAFANKAFELGMTKEQANKLRDWHNDVVASSFKDADVEIEKEHGSAVESLKKEWGSAYQANVDLANKVVQAFDKELKLVDLGLGNNVELVKVFAKIGKSMSEDKLIVGEADKTPGNAQTEINSIMGDSKSPYWNNDHPQHKDYVAKVQEFFRQKHPES
jgi:hypothetical protein